MVWIVWVVSCLYPLQEVGEPDCVNAKALHEACDVHQVERQQRQADARGGVGIAEYVKLPVGFSVLQASNDALVCCNVWYTCRGLHHTTN